MSLLSAHAQQTSALQNLEKFVRNINAFNALFPQEKVYLHFDNTGYAKGETIWFKAYVLRTDSMKPSNISHVLYVELLNPSGEVYETQKIYLENGQGYGDFKLDKPMGSGFYEIRAYTRYMTNWDTHHLFSRVFPIFTRNKKTAQENQKINSPLNKINFNSIYLRLP